MYFSLQNNRTVVGLHTITHIILMFTKNHIRNHRSFDNAFKVNNVWDNSLIAIAKFCNPKMFYRAMIEP
uniref:Uncharacterized protein n=1 Tax=Arundo donax TaxID=35708 RepID=A0A0A9ESP5_ARUDO